jgi:murein DD-endopeptidase MepM/ murein hydrolase activator NlpD
MAPRPSMVTGLRGTGARLLVALALAAAGGGTAAFLAPGGAGATPQTPCGADQTVAEDPDSCVPDPTTTTTTTETTTTPTTTTTATTTTPEPTPIPTVTIPNGGSGKVVPPPAKPVPTESNAKPAKTPSPSSKGIAPPQHHGPTKAKPILGGGPYVFPVYGPAAFTDTYGAFRSGTGWHHGDDIFAPLGAPVLAVADGTLFLVGWNRMGGNRLWLRDDAGNFFYYAHLAAFSPVAVAGARVSAGALLGFVGDTGDARGTPPHLHFEVHPVSMIPQGYDGAANPTPYLRAWQRLQRLRFTSSDLLLTNASGWSAAVAAPSAAPGAILLDSNDISSATSLDPKSVAKALAPPPPRVRSWKFRQAVAKRKQPPLIHLSAKAQRQAVKAESLDQGAALPPGFPGSSIWDTLAQCEAGGDWTANTGNGFYGGLQFTAETWLEHGGGAFAPAANHASREQQIAIAQRVLETQGWVAWPACSLKLGFR